MEWVEDLHGQIVGLDTAPLIYYLEEHPGYPTRVDPFFAALARGRLEVVTSTGALVEPPTLPRLPLRLVPGNPPRRWAMRCSRPARSPRPTPLV